MDNGKPEILDLGSAADARVKVKVGGQEEIEVDFIAASIRLGEIANEAKDKSTLEYYDAVRDYVAGLGLPDLPAGKLYAFIRHMHRLTEELEKKVEAGLSAEPAGSPGSTGSTPTAGPPSS